MRILTAARIGLASVRAQPAEVAEEGRSGGQAGRSTRPKLLERGSPTETAATALERVQGRRTPSLRSTAWAGTWTRKAGSLLVSYSNDYRRDLEAPRDGMHLKMPAPAMRGKYCYLARSR